MGRNQRIDEVSKIQEQLLEKRAEVLSRIQTAEAKQRYPGSANPDRVDLAMDFAARERRTILLSGMEQQLEQIDAALQRIEAGSYGTCTSCGKQIAEERLELLPQAPHCMHCQRAQERQGYL